jgi:tetrahydromethanopterin S-methyltransferase subunit F
MPGNSVRVECRHCGTTNDIASEGAVRVANTLEEHGIRVPDNPMSLEDIESEIAEKDRLAKESARTTGIVIGVLLALFAAVVVLSMLFGD